MAFGHLPPQARYLWTSSHRPINKGTSAFTGTHRTKGHLGEFMRQREGGTIPKSSYLIIENPARLSREAPQEAQYWMLTIQRVGVRIHVAKEGVDFAPKGWRLGTDEGNGWPAGWV